MSWVKVDDNAPSHPKVCEAMRLGGAAAFALVVALWCQARRHDSRDGYLPEGAVQRVMREMGCKAKHRRALEASGLLETVDGGGNMIHDYSDYGPRDERRQENNSGPDTLKTDERDKFLASERDRKRCERDRNREKARKKHSASADSPDASADSPDASADSPDASGNLAGQRPDTPARAYIHGRACAPPGPGPGPGPGPEEGKSQEEIHTQQRACEGVQSYHIVAQDDADPTAAAEGGLAYRSANTHMPNDDAQSARDGLRDRAELPDVVPAHSEPVKTILAPLALPRSDEPPSSDLARALLAELEKHPDLAIVAGGAAANHLAGRAMSSGKPVSWLARSIADLARDLGAERLAGQLPDRKTVTVRLIKYCDNAREQSQSSVSSRSPLRVVPQGRAIPKKQDRSIPAPEWKRLSDPDDPRVQRREKYEQRMREQAEQEAKSKECEDTAHA